MNGIWFDDKLNHGAGKQKRHDERKDFLHAQDGDKIVRAFKRRGYTISRAVAMKAWASYSKVMGDCQWLELPELPSDMIKAIGPLLHTTKPVKRDDELANIEYHE